MADNKRRSARVLAERKRSIYFEPTTDDDFDESGSEGGEDYQPERQRSLSPGPSRLTHSAKKRKVHTQPTSQAASKKRKVDRRPKPQTRAREKRREKFKSRGVGQSSKKRGVNWLPNSPSKNKDAIEKGFTGPSDGRIPDWTRLPPEIWRDIFTFASQPIHEQTIAAISNVTWLMRTARTCRALAVPALEAYYQSPSILSTMKTQGLMSLVQRPQDELYMSYRHRVKSLEIDVRQLAQGAKGSHPFRLDDLVRELPRLQDLQIVHPKHTPPYRSIRKQTWTYPIHLFLDLKSAGVRLKSWRWTGNMVPIAELDELYKWMTEAHSSEPFVYLERLVVCDFSHHLAPERPPMDDDNTTAPADLASTLSALPRVKDLTFISCDLVAEDFLERLPRNLERLELSNCLEATADMLYTYLSQGGAHLRELVLNHNAALSLGFLEHLKSLCPRLEVLQVDMTCYSERMNYNDALALYDHVLTVDQIPTWPSTLRHLELVHLQKWEAEAAQNLFRSLVESAKELPDLRHLALQAHINIPWRDRAGFRDQWIERLQRVYLRKKEPPSAHLGSLKQFRMWKEAQQVNLNKAETKVHESDMRTVDSDSEDETPVRRQLSHVRITPRKAPIDALVYSDTASPVPKAQSGRPRRSVRVAESQSQSASTAAEESSSESEDEPEDDWRSRPEACIQGLCEVVDIRIDNQRPRENQYTEANFLDSEPSGDEDWQEGAELSDDDPYAW